MNTYTQRRWNAPTSILWYDLETFGLNPRVDRIAQCSMIRTDLDLNEIGEPIKLYCRLTDDYLPNPESCLVTGITPDVCNELGMNEFDFITAINDEMLVPGTITAGYNNTGFDDECIRACLYRNLMDPYERENREGRGRWDILNLVRACHDLRPEGINFSTINPESGYTSFKLTDITAENGIEQVGAHDALVDVIATIEVARLIKTKQPRLFDYAFRHRTKYDIWKLVDMQGHKPILHTLGFYSSEFSDVNRAYEVKRSNTHPLLPLWRSSEKSNDLWCFDMTKKIPESIESIEDMRDAGFMKIQANRCPFVSPLSVLTPAIEERLGYTREHVEAIEKDIKQNHRWMFDLSPLFENKAEFEKETDEDYTIYDSFASQTDKNLMKHLSLMTAEEKISRPLNFEDTKYHKLVWRQVARNWPEALSEKEKAQWKNFCASRLINPPSKYALTFEYYMRTCEDGMNSLETDPEAKMVYKKLKDWGLHLQETILK